MAEKHGSRNDDKPRPSQSKVQPTKSQAARAKMLIRV
eukprot:CAMPEP_0115079922 /NCGR_PEP_ID=MMETSP0227-20121206/18382_1 /TAXON_ID=89957 /ORGANISM="Polarella glacialis, Strain CCMP 1383" /LENGTH=36 /DNA_ID= /DNA_START= /DNA_END= /DNA_ORIENTATION=